MTRWSCSGLVFLGALAALAGAEPAPISVRTAPGRFEVAAADGNIAHRVATAAEEAWRTLAGPLGLPGSFSTPVFVRIDSAGVRGGEAPFGAAVEPGGVVSVWFGPEVADGPLLRPALAHGLLLRLAVARQGAVGNFVVPSWLEQACAGWWSTRQEGAQLDALKYESQRLPPVALAELLAGGPAVASTRAFAVSATWLLVFLQAEPGKGGGWPAFLPRLLGGEPPERALAACYPDRFADAAERELWWQTGYHHVRRVRTLPALDSAETRERLEALARFVFAAGEGDADVIVPVRAVVAHASEPIVTAEFARRAAELEHLVPALHPFYRNAGLSLVELLRAAPRDPARRVALCSAFEQDWQDARELHAAATTALEALERR